ncbi:MAG: NAD(P)/FAD-dependent oxidoreductase [Lachnospiraceae bacterium]|nr:NAD(P)/FAD-dependent oxidoreductase [Lachnospiraceae bacterium]
MSSCIVIGGGAAGMMAAYRAAQRGHKVLLLEKNEKLGKKVYITGKGRCNLTNACDTEDFFSSVVTNPKFLYSAVYGFGPDDIVKLLNTYGCPTKVERGNRVFPVSDHASDVIFAMQRALKEVGVQVRLDTTVSRIFFENHAVSGVECKNGKRLYADNVIVCTGGVSYPSTGSTGDGYRFASEAGLSVTERYPALVSLTCRESWCRDLAGLSLKNVQVTLMDGKWKVFQNFGEMLFTHHGVSGPLILSASSYYTGRYAGRELPLYIDLKPALSAEQLDKRLLRDFEANLNKQFKNALDQLFPSGLIPVMIRLSEIDPSRKVNDITREERRAFGDLIKALPLTVTGTGGFEEAIITQGGVDVKEINPSTMESKTVKGLYFAGEVLNLDALTGGFNLQIAWSTGFLAGDSVM